MNYRNPLYVAKEYARMIETGEAKSESDLARKLGISRVRVNHFIRLLKLDGSIIRSFLRLILSIICSGTSLVRGNSRYFIPLSI